MTVPIRNRAFDKITEAGSLTDVELYKVLTKDDTVLSEGKFNKALLDLEILGLIKVSWITKDEKRIEAFADRDKEEGEGEEREESNTAATAAATVADQRNKKIPEKDYEASFPGFER